jgi:hypothetical protein
LSIWDEKPEPEKDVPVTVEDKTVSDAPRRVHEPRKKVVEIPEDLDEVIRQLDHMSYNPRLNSGYRNVAARAAVLLRKSY